MQATEPMPTMRNAARGRRCLAPAPPRVIPRKVSSAQNTASLTSAATSSSPLAPPLVVGSGCAGDAPADGALPANGAGLEPPHAASGISPLPPACTRPAPAAGAAVAGQAARAWLVPTPRLPPCATRRQTGVQASVSLLSLLPLPPLWKLSRPARPASLAAAAADCSRCCARWRPLPCGWRLRRPLCVPLALRRRRRWWLSAALQLRRPGSNAVTE